VLVFLDDILVYSDTVEEHEQHLRVVLERLRAAKLYAKWSKCEFYQPEVDFLGHIVGQHGLKMMHDKVAAIVAWPTPTCAKDVEQFIGLCGYYRRFIVKFSEVAAPLSSLTGTRTKKVNGVRPEQKVWRWDAAEDAAFAQLKTLITSAPCLILPDCDLSASEFVLHTDASGGATGACLMQDQGAGMQPVAFMSKRMNAAEMNYSTRDQEFLAIKQACGAWRHYLMGKHFVIHSDHESLQFMRTSELPTRRHNRWEALMADFDFTIKYIRGEMNPVADGLSRSAALGAAPADDVVEDFDGETVHLGAALAARRCRCQRSW